MPNRPAPISPVLGERRALLRPGRARAREHPCGPDPSGVAIACHQSRIAVGGERDAVAHVGAAVEAAAALTSLASSCASPNPRRPGANVDPSRPAGRVRSPRDRPPALFRRPRRARRCDQTASDGLLAGRCGQRFTLLQKCRRRRGDGGGARPAWSSGECRAKTGAIDTIGLGCECLAHQQSLKLHLGRWFVSASPAWLASIVHVPAPMKLTVDPHRTTGGVSDENDTSRPEEAVAATA